MTARIHQEIKTQRPDPAGDAGDASRIRLVPLAIFLAIHGPLAVAMRQNSLLATAHALGTLLVGTLWALQNRVDRVAYVTAYIASAEVLWRMCRCPLPWEFGKYATCLVCLIGLLRSGSGRTAVAPLVYFGLQLPSIALVVGNSDLHQLRSDLSFYLSGPLSLTLTAVFFARLGMSLVEFTKLVLAFLGPTVGIASVAVFRISTAAFLRLSGGSNVSTSGGFGPNQVSAVLGLGSLLAVLAVMSLRRELVLRGLLLCLALLLAGQSALTFSRTGLYCACGSLLIAVLCGIQDPRLALRMTVGLGVTALVFYFGVFPFLVDFTKGGITKRFADTGTTGREELMKIDLDLWYHNPILGVGPGVSASSHVLHRGVALASHSELTRLLAEHGIFGLAALLLLLGMGCWNCVRAQTGLCRSIAVSLVAWALLYMFSNGVRIVTPCFLYGLSFGTLTFGTGKRDRRRRVVSR
jgi:hypothetical protein